MNASHWDPKPVSWSQCGNHRTIRPRILRLEASIAIRIKTHSFIENAPSACHSKPTVISPLLVQYPVSWHTWTASVGSFACGCSRIPPTRSWREEGKWGQVIYFSGGFLFCEVTWTGCILSQVSSHGPLSSAISLGLCKVTAPQTPALLLSAGK